jgi:hypothetical protein
VATGFEDRDLIPALQAFIKHDNAEGLTPVLTTANWKVLAEQYRER